MERQEVVDTLNGLLSLQDVLACMVVKKGLEGIVPPKIKIKNIDLWRLIHDATDEIFDITTKFYNYGILRVNIELGNYNIIVAPINKDVSLVIVTNSLANVGLLDVEIENTKRLIEEKA